MTDASSSINAASTPTLWYGWHRSDGSPFSAAPVSSRSLFRLALVVQARVVQARSGSLAFTLAAACVARVRPCVRLRVRARIHSCVCSRVRVRPGRTPGSDQARHPRQRRSLGSERGLATPSPDGKGEIPLGPSVKIMPVDSYSTLGRSCEPAFKWIRQAQPRPSPGPGPAAVPSAGCAAVSGARGWLVRAGRPRGELLVHLTGKLTRGPAVNPLSSGFARPSPGPTQAQPRPQSRARAARGGVRRSRVAGPRWAATRRAARSPTGKLTRGPARQIPGLIR